MTISIFYLVIFAMPIGSIDYPKISITPFYSVNACDKVRDFYNQSVAQTKTTGIAICVQDNVPK